MDDAQGIINLLQSLLTLYVLTLLLAAHRRLDKLEEKVAADIKRREFERLR